ncbi:MAG TPA: TraB/GumN family protein [Noviherbaspirillum sp.]|nr:TraB/GumN family protein [Noviherbaspirillum sp.]
MSIRSAFRCGMAGALALSCHLGQAGNLAAASAAHLMPQPSALVGPAPVSAPHHGGLYRVSRDGRVAYLFGTVHVGASSLYPLAPEVSRALSSARRVVVELDVDAGAAFARAVARHGRYPEGDHILNHIGRDTLADMTERLHAHGVSVSSMSRYKPWLVANLLLSMELERAGYRRRDGVERVLLQAARRRGAAVAELESADYQLGLFDTMNDIDAERYLRETLRGLDDGSVMRRARAVLAAWTSGDAQALDALLHDATAGRGVVEDFTRRVLLGRRNPQMVAHIEQLMRQDGVAFVGVGLLHLLGANGLPQLLAQRGYLVEQVY